MVRRIYCSDLLAFLRFNPFVVDEQTDWLGVFAAIRGCEFN